jgi:hypothetical protein
MLNGNNTHQKKRGLRVRLNKALRSLAGLQRQNKVAQVFLDLACRIETSQGIDTSRLPTNPDGFIVKQTAILRHRGMDLETLCLYQIVSMTMLYYWLYSEIGDVQDARSCDRYLEWLEAYNKTPVTFSVVGSVRDGYYLWTGEGDPHPPEWLTEDEGETV